MDKRLTKKYETFSEELKIFIETRYKEEYSVSIIHKEVQERFGKIGRGPISDYLKSIGIYEGLNGPNYLKKKVENNEKIMMERYGVINWGQTKEGGYRKQNKIPYNKISYLDDGYKKYRDDVEKITRKNIKKLDAIPKYCEYTGILFADENGATNPNDPRKRSVDHKIPAVICYLNGISAEDAGSIDNIIFVLKYVNSIKSNTEHNSFLSVAHKIRKVFINEGYESN